MLKKPKPKQQQLSLYNSMEDFHLKQWRCHQQPESDLQQHHHHPPIPSSSPSSATAAAVAKFPILQEEEEEEEEERDNTTHKQQTLSSALHLFVPEITTSAANKNNNNNNININDKSVQLLPPTSTFIKMGSYFSLAQWQELELQALIYKHMLAGSSIPPELLHLLKKTLLAAPTTTTTSPSLPPYYLPSPCFQQYSHYHSALLQSGHWGRAAMDPEPGRCRRTDGKKWRCSKDVVAGHKYCDRHMHRGRNRSRKPVELPQPPSAAASGGNVLRANSNGNNVSAAPQPFAATMMDCGAGGHFDLSPPSHLLHLNQRPLDVDTEKSKSLFDMQHEVSRDSKQGGERVLRHFFDDWPRPHQELPNAAIDTCSGSGRSSTSLSISTPASDFSLKLSTGNAENTERDPIQLNWASGWGASPMGGGPLAEALRSSLASDSSPTSVLHHLPRNSTSETSYVSN